MPGPDDTFIAYGRGWANVSNTPFREYKHWVHEGGISTPLIAHWPQGIKTVNRWFHEPGHLIDLMATCADLAGAERPAQIDGTPVPKLEGLSLRPAFQGESLGRKNPLFWEHEGNRAVRDGKWKLVAKENQPWELYDIEADRTEQQNLASSQPQRVQAMAAQWDAWAARANVLPLGTWRGTQAASFSAVRRFEFAGSAHLPQATAPMVQEQAFKITVTLVQPGETGVLVAQGGRTHGYTLFLNQGALTFAIRRNGQLTALAAKSQLPKTAKTIVAAIDRYAQATLTIDGQEAAAGKLAGLVQAMPIDGFQVGRDGGDPVGDYAGPNPFTGQIKNVVVELGDVP
jgi:arylsulfatase